MTPKAVSYFKVTYMHADMPSIETRQAATELARALVIKLRSDAKQPVIRSAVKQAMREMGRQFVLGQTIEEALKNRRAGYRYSFDMLGEAAISTHDARRYEAAYREAAEALAPYCNSESVHDNPGISVKLSALHPRYETLQSARVMAELLPRLSGLARPPLYGALGQRGVLGRRD